MIDDIPKTGIAGIDAEHAQFAALLDRFNAGEPTCQDLYRMLAEVVLYTELHLTNEETLMRAAGYPGYAEHKAQHDRAEAEMHRLAAHAENEAMLRDALGRFMLDWLLHHIRTADLAFAQWLAEQGALPTPEAPSARSDLVAA